MKEEIIRFNNQAYQGDLCLNRIDALPQDAIQKEIKDQMCVLAHSETGHHHGIVAPPGAVELFGSANPNLSYLKVNKAFVHLQHFRDFDTHKTLEIGQGIYEVRRQVEKTPDGWRQVMD